MDQNIRRIGLITWVLLLAAAVVAGLTANYVNSTGAWAAALVMKFGFLVALMSYFQMRLEARERLEKLEFDELNRARGASSLFATSEAENFPARHSREQFERYFMPAITVILLLLQMLVIHRMWRSFAEATPIDPGRAAIGMAILGLFALVLFLLGRYATGLARIDNQRLLRPGASFLLLSSYLCFLATAGIGIEHLGFGGADLVIARVLAVLLGLIALELLLGLVLEIYRPRVKGRPARVLYESRLAGLLGRPERLVTTAAHALDYQFGFKVSETWFYRFLQRVFAWLLLLQLGVLFLSSSIVFIEPGEQALIERFGRPIESRPVLDPGPHLKLPWPIDKVQRFRTREVQSFSIGFEPHEDDHDRAVLLWNVSHYKEEVNMLVASREQLERDDRSGEAPPVNLLTVSIPVQYQIGDVHAWAYRHADSTNLLKWAATREVVRYLVSVDFHDIMSVGRVEAARELRARIQERADALGLGVSILFVGLQDIHPPVAVAEAYQAVVGVGQQVEAEVLQARAYREREVPTAQAAAQRLIREAEIFHVDTVSNAAARAAQFTDQLTAYAAAPFIFARRAQLEAASRAIGAAPKKTVIAVPGASRILELDLKEALTRDVLDVEIPD